MPRLQVCDAIIHRLVAHWGIRHAFALSGGAILPLRKSAGARLNVTNMLNESSCVFAADGLFRASGEIGVVLVTSGPGITNTITALISARMDHIPLIVISGQPRRSDYGKFAFQELSPLTVDIDALLGGICKLTCEITPEQCVQQVDQAVNSAMAIPRGPVHLSLPLDVSRMPASIELPLTFPELPSLSLQNFAEINRACELIEGAHRVAILAGYGAVAAQAAEAIETLACCIGASIFSTPKAKSAFLRDSRNFFGTIGFPGNPEINAILLDPSRFDVLLVFGSRLGEWSSLSWDSRIWSGRRVIWADIEPREVLGLMKPDVMLLGDLKTTVVALSARLATLEVGAPLSPPILLNPDLGDCLSEDLHPMCIVTALTRLLPPSANVFVDIGNSMLWMIPYFQPKRRYSFHINLGYAAMGYATAAAVGAAQATPDTVSVAVVGDGAFLMNGNEVATASWGTLPIVWIVLNNGGYGMLEQVEQEMAEDSMNDSRFPARVDIAKIADGLGAASGVARSCEELSSLLTTALQARSAFVIDARIGASYIPPSLAYRSKQLR